MEYQEKSVEELGYLNTTLDFLKSELSKELAALSETKKKLISSHKDMWEDAGLFLNDFDRVIGANQYLMEVKVQSASYYDKLKLVEKYKRLLNSPYFGRFDFVEYDSRDSEKIYIGLSSVIDSKTGNIMVYDWRAPISSIYYQYELGKASYNSPAGTISGTVTLKRQYKIRNSELKYFFDSSIKIDDEVLQEILSQNSSDKMRHIVESIQKEQDIVIRDKEYELLIVQGVAGSGKTSIALHRIAFLLYQGLNTQLESHNILIISPNMIFSKYISSVLPELGEDNVTQVSFEGYASSILQEKTAVESRNAQLEYLIASKNQDELSIKLESMEFKGSACFVELLDRIIDHYERNVIAFEDISYDGKIIFTRQQLKTLFLNNRIGLPIAKRLKRVENIIYSKIHPLRKNRTEKIEKFVQKLEGYELEIKSFSRLLLLKQSQVFQKRLKKITDVDYFKLYETLFNQQGLLPKLAAGLSLPGSLEHIITATIKNLNNGQIGYEDCAPLLYLKLRLEGSDSFSDIKHVVIDEAQDYEPVQYEVFKLLFMNASYTVLGDIHQRIEKDVDNAIYDNIIRTFQKKKSLKINLNKSYRSSFEITEFSKNVLGNVSNIEALQRHDDNPTISCLKTVEDIDSALIQGANNFRIQGYESIAILCRTALEAESLYDRLQHVTEINLISSDNDEIQKGITIMPIYLAKGLEFDVVLIYNASMENFSTELDRKLLYIACTRALHRLVIYYSGIKSSFI